FRRARGRGNRLDLHVRRRREDALGALVLGAPLRGGERVRRRKLRQVLADEMNAFVAHWTTLRRKSDGLEPSRDERGATRSCWGESHGRSPRDGHHETRSPEQNEERPRPATG